jgi:ubiquinone/menaquinone biosynthesis C-methylase UbiE
MHSTLAALSPGRYPPIFGSILVLVWNGAEYQRRFDSLAESGMDVHGEATFVRAFAPKTVLDAGCGTGRVAIELARHGIEVVGADLDESMLAYAREHAPDITWVRSDLAELDLGRTFDVVVMAGNVPLFTAPGTQDKLVRGVARHVGNVLIAGFSLDRGYTVEEYDEHCARAGLRLVERFATWNREEFRNGNYAVSVHLS